MTHELFTLLLPIGKYLLASTLLVLFYMLFYRGKTTYDLSRKYLISIAMVALLLSQFQIVIKNPPVQVVRVQAALVAPAQICLPLNAVKSPPSSETFPQRTVREKALVSTFLNKPFPNTLANENQRKTPLKTKITSWFTLPHTLLLVYGTVSLILIVSFIFQYFKIISMKRKGVVRQWDGFEIVESADIPTPFSFCKTIFIGSNLSGKKLDVVIKHEQWHIRHHHYVDVMVMETLVRLLWFNPLLWWIRKELRNISEFQADRSVLDEGHELYQYQTIILEEVMEQNPYLANGFNNSFTKKRFIMMKNSIQGRFSILRRAILLPFLISVFCLLCFTQGKGETRYILDEPIVQNASESKSMDAMLAHVVDVPKMELKLDESVIPDSKDIDQVVEKTSASLGLAIDYLSLAIKATNRQSRIQNLQKVFAHLDIKFNQMQGGQLPISESLCETISDQDLILAKNQFVEIKKDIDHLKKEPDTPAKAQKFHLLAMELIQQPMVTKILEAQMSGMSDMLNKMMVPMVDAMKKIKTDLQEDETDSEDAEEYMEFENQLKIDKEILQKAYILKSYQAKILDIKTDGQKLLSIQKHKKETLVRIAMPNINRSAGSWFRLDKNFRIIDKRTNDKYFLRKAEPDIPLNQVIYTCSIPNQVIEITLIFPPLKNDVEMVDIIETYSSDLICPSYGMNPCEFRNVKLQDYLMESDEGGDIIK